MSQTVAVVGSGAGGMAVAAALAEGGESVHLCDLPRFTEHVDAVAERGGVELVDFGSDTGDLIEVAGAGTDIEGMAASADLVVIVAPLLAHAELLEEVGGTEADLLFLGEGGGALRAVGGGREPESVAETNTLPYLARVRGPGAVSVRPKPGGVFLASADPAATGAWMERLRAYWPDLESADDVIDTLLANYNAIDHVPTVLANAGFLEAGEGSWRLWGEGCTPAVARAIDALDSELHDFRAALELPERRYGDCLVAQGFAPRVEEDLYGTIQGSVLADAEVARHDGFLQTRFIREDVPHALVLIESLARSYGLEAPLVSSLITFTSALLGEDVRESGTTLEGLGFESAEELDRRVRGSTA